MRIGAANLLFAATVVASWPTCSTAKLILDPDSNTHGDPKVGGRLLSRPKDGQRHYGCWQTQRKDVSGKLDEQLQVQTFKPDSLMKRSAYF